MSTNIVVIRGNLTRDPEIRHTPSGVAVASFALAFNERRRDKVQETTVDVAHFFDCKAFGKTAELVGQHLAKGANCIVRGRLAQERWETKGGDKRSKVVILADGVDFVTRGGRDEMDQRPPEETVEKPKDDDENLPF
jgi:single-strand DNA-binding protein